MSRLAVLALLACAALPLAARAAGPSPGVVQGRFGLTAGTLEYTATRAGAATVVVARRGDATVRSARVAGDWGIPLVTYGQELGGLSHDGRTLVLAEPLAQGDQPLRSTSRFLVLNAGDLSVKRRLQLRGDFSFDALSPHGRTLFLVHHVDQNQLTRYKVRAVDLRTGRLLPRVIADKRQASWVMNGVPVARATGPGGRWAYTLYSNPGNYPFVHALDTVTKTAVCIGIPWQWTKDMNPSTMQIEAGTLVIRIGREAKRYELDTKTLRLRS